MLITEFRQGTPCWFELSSTDTDASFRFYEAVFGWQRSDMDLGPVGIYSFLSNANGSIGAFCSMQEEQKTQGVPSHWAVYFSVDDCDAMTQRAAELGGAVIVHPMDVSGHGRLSVISDPTGAVFCLWQSKSTEGGNFVMNEDFAIGWVELATRETNMAREFYSALFGWVYSESPLPMLDSASYSEISVGDNRFGGILPMSAEWGNTPAHWAIYILVPDVEACIAQALKAGGQHPVPAFDVPKVGRIAMISDPTGAHCYIIRLNQ